MKHLFVITHHDRTKDQYYCSFQNNNGDVLAETVDYPSETACAKGRELILDLLLRRAKSGGICTPYVCAEYYYCCLLDGNDRILLRTKTCDTEQESKLIWDELMQCVQGSIHRYSHLKEKERLTLPFDANVMNYMYSLDGQGRENVLNYTTEQQWTDAASWLWNRDNGQMADVYSRYFHEMPTTRPADFTVEVRTGDKPFADTRAAVYITLYSENWQSEEFKLEGKPPLVKRTLADVSAVKRYARESAKNRGRGKAEKLPAKDRLKKQKVQCGFLRNGTAVFQLDMLEDPGELTKIRIRHDNTGEEPEWYLRDIRIVKVRNGRKWYFPCNRWMYAQQGQETNDLTLYPQYQPKEEVYDLRIRTGDNSVKAGTDANVFVTFYGSKGNSQEYRLDSTLADFDKGGEDRLTVTVNKELGNLERLRIRHDNSGACPSWYLRDIRVSHEGLHWDFPCERWFAKDEGDKTVDWTLVAASKNENERVYAVRVHTGSCSNAGTAARVYITLHGTKGVSREIRLNNDGNDFKNGAVDTYRITVTEDVGEVTKLRVRHDNFGLMSGWYLEDIRLEQVGAGKNWYFPCGQWFEKSDDDSTLDRMLTPVPEGGQEAAYSVIVRTGDISGAGTDSKVYITLYGSTFTSREYRLDNNRNNFEKGKSDTFSIVLPEKLGEVEKIRIRHDSSGLFPGWYLEDVRLEQADGERSWYFPCGRWLDKNKEDGSVDLTLQAAEERKEGGDQA